MTRYFKNCKTMHDKKCCNNCNLVDTCPIYENIKWDKWDVDKDYCSKFVEVKEPNDILPELNKKTILEYDKWKFEIIINRKYIQTLQQDMIKLKDVVAELIARGKE